MNAVPIEPTNATTPVIQVSARRPRQAAMKNFPHRCTTMTAKKISVLHRCSELTKWPVPERVPPGGSAQGQQPARDQHDHEGGEGEHPEDVDPGGDVDRLAVREGLPRRNQRRDPGA